MEDVFYYAVLGFSCLALALWFPYRRMAARPEIGWDIVSFLAVFLYFFLYDRYIDSFINSAADSQGYFDAWQSYFLASVPPVITILLYILLADFGLYWSHRALHSRWLWSQHAWHHAPGYVYFGSGIRATVVHVFVTVFPYTVAAIIIPAFSYGQFFFYIFLFDTLNQHYTHSNIDIPKARWLEKVFVTPRMHQIHHHANPLRTNSNYGSVFSLWDRLFGTFTDPDTVSLDEPLGLDYPASNWKMFLGLPSRITDGALQTANTANR
jgi:sterol desaturase/sphingolipid hydroxylase (fatty acid hydroxylase superfamily)